ncbi:(d)CMP kinase [bacterium]|nr:(d)CMP kinase [bacterium]
MRNKITIAIDGPAGSGKSSVSKIVAKRLGLLYIDTGAMYRALTLKAMKKGINLEEETALVELANNTKIELIHQKEGTVVLLDGQDVTDGIRETNVTNNVFYLARTEEVRECMKKLQRKIAEKGDVVMEGRDITTVILPDADYKFYLDASFEERVKRRRKELEQNGKQVAGSGLSKDIKIRDEKDFTRKIAPLRKAKYAIVIDSTGMSLEEEAATVISYIK